MRLHLLLLLGLSLVAAKAEDLGDTWGTGEREETYYRLVNVPVPEGSYVEAASFDNLPDGRLAIGTRRGEILLMSGASDEHPRPSV